ncbi:CRTAC1 family protein [Paraglaciecola sp. L3A3]|uniref:CRTAC1 family protein n=1 Tax=Paraglaciecola sp. L3A3 TaxID=2686358 RepID=UPI00131AA64A|nr:CRTAC1 family protein [Paraglaciecola sp. L3A3]
MKTHISFYGMALTCLFGCQSAYSPSFNKQSVQPTTNTLFVETTDIAPLEARARRKWDAAVIADLDKDGYQDMLLTEHAAKVRLFWNNQGVFSQPVDFVLGDTHGIAVGDYDHDGRMDIVVSQGGGGGKKPRYPKIFTVNADRSIVGGDEFTLVERTRGRAAKLVDSNQDGKLDLVLSAFPLKSQKKGANHLYLNQGHLQGNQQQSIGKAKKGQHELVFERLLPTAKWLGYRTLVTDFNNDNISDLVFYGGKNMVAVQGLEGGKYKNVSPTVFDGMANTSDVSTLAEIDFDNDGDLDLFATRAKHQFTEQRYYDQENQRFAFFARNQKFRFDDLTIKGNFKLENLQMAFPHFDVFIGKSKKLYSFSEEKHGGHQLELTPEQAAGWPQKLIKKGLYIGYLGEGVWRIAGDTASPTAGVVHNVVSKPSVIEDELLPVKLLENRDGKFVDVTAQLGIDIQEQTTSATVGDFDNDGWSDIFVMRYGSMAQANEQILLTNQQGKGFIAAVNHGLISSELGATGGGAESFDFDKDGDLDMVFANERGRWHLFENQTNSKLKSNFNSHQFITLEVGDSPKGKATAQGAKLQFTACGNTYVRVVGATSSAFSHSANNQLHVGLGSCNQVEQAVITWSNGEQSAIEIPDTNESYKAGKF